MKIIDNDYLKQYSISKNDNYRQGGNDMQRQNYMITAEEVAESMGISLGYAYKLLRKLNKELADQGYVTVAGKIPRAFWEKKFYGYSQIAM